MLLIGVKKWIKSTQKNSTRQFGKPYLLSNPDELNMIADAMENKLGLCYTTHIINCHHQQFFFNAVCKSTVNIAFLRLQPKITRMLKIQQDTNNEGKWKESVRRQTKKCLIMLNQIPENK